MAVALAYLSATRVRRPSKVQGVRSCYALLLLSDAFLVIYGDSYLPIDYSPVWQHLVDTPVQAVAVVYDNCADTTVPNNIALDAEGFICRYRKDVPGDPGFRYVEAGVLALRRAVVTSLPTGRPVSLEKEVFPSLIEQRQMAVLSPPNGSTISAPRIGSGSWRPF